MGPAKFVLICSILLLTIISTVAAEEFTFVTGEEKVFKGITIKLLGVGTLGSALFKVGESEAKVSKNNDFISNDFNITLLQSSGGTAKILISQNVQCLINSDCISSSPCTEGTCTAFRKCTYKKINGCPLDNDCMPTGSLGLVNNELQYCDTNFEWQNRKPFNTRCESNYECLSNICKENLCTKPKEQEIQDKMAPKWLMALFGIIILAKGYFVLMKTEKIKTFYRELSYSKSKNLKIVGGILLVLGFFLIYWGLS